MPGGSGAVSPVGQSGADPGAVAQDEDGAADQPVVPRKAERDLPCRPGGVDAEGEKAGASRADALERDVPGGMRVQLLHRTQKPADKAAEWQERARANPSDGRGMGRPRRVRRGTPLLQASLASPRLSGVLPQRASRACATGRVWFTAFPPSPSADTLPRCSDPCPTHTTRGASMARKLLGVT